MIEDRQIETLVLQERLIDDAGLDEARRQQRRHGGDLYSVLIENGFVDEEKTITCVSRQLHIPCVSLRDFDPDQDLMILVPAQMAARHRVIPLGVSREQEPPALYMAMANPIDMIAMDEIGEFTGLDIVGYLAGPLDIDRTLERCYGQAIYQHQVQSLGGLLGDGSNGPRDPFAGPSVSQLLELPMLEELGAHKGPNESREPIAFAGGSAAPPPKSRNSLRNKGSSTRLEAPPPLIHAPGPILDSVDLASLEAVEDDEMLEVELEGFGDPQDSELFGVRGSKIFMPPESLTEAGRRRLMEATQGVNLEEGGVVDAEAGNSTVLGPFKTLDDEEAVAMAKAAVLRAHAARSGVTSVRDSTSRPAARGQAPPPAPEREPTESTNLAPFPRELTARSVRVLNQAYKAFSTEEVFGAASSEELLMAVINVLLHRGLITEAEILRELARTKENP